MKATLPPPFPTIAVLFAFVVFLGGSAIILSKHERPFQPPQTTKEIMIDQPNPPGANAHNQLPIAGSQESPKVVSVPLEQVSIDEEIEQMDKELRAELADSGVMVDGVIVSPVLPLTLD